jgi:peptidoglycan/LPS O-acetylase OafA/YrhL
MKYRSDIDGLRALAVIPVALYHAHFPGVSGGFVGVDIFFVISGYLICSLITAELASNNFSIVRFYERRCRRILPALFAMFAAISVIASFVLLPSDTVIFCQSLEAAAVFVSNIYFWHNANYFDGASDFKPLLHTWSLGVEEQFYIFVPLILFAIARWSKSKYTSWLLSLSAVSLALSVWASTHAPTANFYLLPTRFWELALGALAAISMSSKVISRPAREAIGAVGIGLIIYSVTMLSDRTPFPGWNALFPCLGAAALLYAGKCGQSSFSSFLSTKPLVFVGKISYSLYLWHWPLFALARYSTGRELTILETSIVLFASLVFAAVSWRYVETPFRKNTVFFNSRLIFAGAGISIVLTVLVGIAGVFNAGYGFRFPDFTVKNIPGVEQYNGRTCFLSSDQSIQDWQGNACLLTHNNGPTVLLWGDSFAAHYAPGISEEAKDLTVNYLQYTASSCPPVFGYYSGAVPNCRVFNDNVPSLLAKYNISTVVMAGRWASLFKRGVSPNDIVATVRRLEEIGVKVYVIGQSPEFYNDVQTLFAQSKNHTASEASAPLSFSRNINSELESVLPAGTFIDPLNVLCGPTDCKYIRDGQYVIWDFGHFSSFGSRLAVANYFPFISDSSINDPERSLLRQFPVVK